MKKGQTLGQTLSFSPNDKNKGGDSVYTKIMLKTESGEELVFKDIYNISCAIFCENPKEIYFHPLTATPVFDKMNDSLDFLLSNEDINIIESQIKTSIINFEGFIDLEYKDSENDQLIESIQKIVSKLKNRVPNFENKSKKTELLEKELPETELPEIDLTTQKEQIRILYELGIIDYLSKRYSKSLKGNNNQMATLVAQFLKLERGSIQPTLNALINDNPQNKNYPKITKAVKSIIDKLNSNESI